MKKVLMCGNEVLAESAIMAGCRFYAGYPITPQNEIPAYMSRRMPEVGGVFIQAESEISAVNMVFGASLTGARAMTSSSSPGISLKQEGISYLAGCELPAVIVNIMRGGPGLGNIAPSQSDYFQATRGGGHGDYRQIVLAPASLQEIVDLTTLAFDLADSYRMPVMILGDGLLGQMMEPVVLADSVERIAYSAKKDWILDGCKGRKPRIIKSLLLGNGELEQFNERLQKKYNEIKNKEVRCEILHGEDSKLMLVAYGTVSRICRKVVKTLREEGKKVGLVRPVSLWPFPEKELRALTGNVERFLTVEMSCGQMVEDVKLGIECKKPVHFYGRSGGGVPTEEEIIKEIEKIMY
ncbi:MAG: 3-methyl-2-oxobutanoate dehydrogenase subunit VorB [Candidatus Omnitrophica bacterium]|nr:3-methyl-2-oxobutanoate dehydrogenase subunit VorB [Candidatus Omnitrophota bacterium]MBU1933529.1 3-methyl-2-oxobutanoate dehydrogenase subunit VorB [Candidatus Omnitrophota bacterium]